MEMEKIGNKIVMVKTMPGVVACRFEHEIKETSANLSYTGPKISREVWDQVLSFFKWCFDTTQSECQVRMFVNPSIGQWRAWAYPQEAKTGMTARELSRAETQEEAAARFAVWGVEPSGEWKAFGTVHHHCRAAAFQSYTDEADEKRQDGLHITIGNMNEPRYTIHSRFYADGMKWEKEMDMSWFWEIGNVSQILPVSCYDTVARHQMCTPSALPFPDQWKQNLIEIKPLIVTPPFNSAPLPDHSYSSELHGSSLTPLYQRAERACTEVIQNCLAANIEAVDIEEALYELSVQGGIYLILWQACKRHNVDPDDLDREFGFSIETALAQRAIQDADAEEVAKYIQEGNKPAPDTEDEARDAQERAAGEPYPNGRPSWMDR